MTKARSNATAPAAKGEIVVGTGSDVSGILAAGSANQVLTVDSATATGLKWAAGGSMTLLSTTSLSGSAVTISSISQSYKHLYLEIADADFSTATRIRLKPEGNTLSELIFTSTSTTGTRGDGSMMGNSTSGGIFIITSFIYNYSSTSEFKTCQYATNFGASVHGFGFIKADDAIDSITVDLESGTFTTGVIRIYGVN